MKTIIFGFSLFLTTVLTIPSFAVANINKLEYGNDLCRFAAATNETRMYCESFVKQKVARPHLTTFAGLALEVCAQFNLEDTPRTSDCFVRASDLIGDEDLKKQTQACDKLRASIGTAAGNASLLARRVATCMSKPFITHHGIEADRLKASSSQNMSAGQTRRGESAAK